MSNKKLRGRADWLDYELVEEIRKEIDAWPDWKKEAYDVDGSRARARSAEYNENCEPTKINGWFIA